MREFWHDAGGRKATRFDGYTNIRKSRQYAAQWQTLTDETAQDMVRTYQQILAENPEFDGALADFGFLQGTLVSFLWPEVEDQTQPYPTLTIYYVDPARLTGLYERREEKLEYYLKTSFQTRRTGSSFWTWTTGWTSPWHTAGLQGGLSILGNGIGGFGQMVLPVVLALALTSVFAGEKRRGMGYAAGDIPAWDNGAGRGKAFCRGWRLRWKSSGCLPRLW